jgi:SAM-dependent methyltransferase
MSDAFRSSAHLYDALSDAGGRLKREGPLLLDLLARAPGQRVIDLACGTGLHAEYLAGHGAAVTAVDLSPDMIAYAEERRGHPNIQFRTGDMCQVAGGPWDVALCLGNSLSLLPSWEAVGAVLRRVHDVLSSGGLFCVQVLNYHALSAQEPRHRVESKQLDGGAEVVAVKSLVPKEDRTFLSLAFFEASGAACSSLSETAVLLHVTDTQLTAMAREAGLDTRGAYGGFDRSPYDPATSSDLVLVLGRP